jgi:hypothetical protein
MPESTPFQRDLQRIETELRRLETEYAKFFADRTPLPPLQQRDRLSKLVQRCDRAQTLESSVHRFRFGTLQARFVTFCDLWDRAMRAREEGRPGPFSKGGPNK